MIGGVGVLMVDGPVVRWWYSDEWSIDESVPTIAIGADVRWLCFRS